MTRLRAMAPILAFAVMMALAISAAVTWTQVGPAPNFFTQWGMAAALSILVMLPSGGLVMAGVAAVVRATLEKQPLWAQRAVMALAMGLLMEAISSALSTLVNLGPERFFSHWLQAYLRAIPLALVMGPLMAYGVRPWVERRLARV
ncbi:DUF2798 domain-containing protein [Variovorax sp. YR752]|uniref:DUF2798 domain-containing protein n=1 Tax=Variovorax sp. YR752 TaxID=1884383 RepID=UPI003137EE54